MVTSDGSLGIRYIQDDKGIVHVAPHQRSYPDAAVQAAPQKLENNPSLADRTNACSDRWPFDLCIEIHILSV